MLKSELSKYVRSRMGSECKCAFCLKPIYDEEHLTYLKHSISARTFYVFYHTRCYNELKRYEEGGLINVKT